MENLKEGLKHTINSNYKIEQLERELKFSDTILNKQNLALEHTEAGNYDRAIELYESCLSGLYTNDEKSIRGLIKNYYLTNKYEAVISISEEIEDKKRFNLTKEKTAVAWSHFHLGQTEEANRVFSQMDIPFSNYDHRLEYATFLDHSNDIETALLVLERLNDEIESMDTYEKNIKRQIIKKIKNFTSSLQKKRK